MFNRVSKGTDMKRKKKIHKENPYDKTNLIFKAAKFVEFMLFRCRRGLEKIRRINMDNLRVKKMQVVLNMFTKTKMHLIKIRGARLIHLTWLLKDGSTRRKIDFNL